MTLTMWQTTNHIMTFEVSGRQPIRLWLMWQTTNQIITLTHIWQTTNQIMIYVADNLSDYDFDLRGR